MMFVCQTLISLYHIMASVRCQTTSDYFAALSICVNCRYCPNANEYVKI